MNEKFRILIICTAILFLCFVGTTSAETWYVDDDGGADFMKIQDAINNASVGDTIIVYSGVYYENVVVNKSVTLMGNGQPVIDAGGEGNAITLTEDGITLVGFTATNSVKDWRNVGIRVTSNNNTITGNDVSNNNNGDGIDLRDSSYNNISGNNVCNNNGDGIDLYDSNNNIIKGNNVCNNNGDGIYFGDSSYNTISGNNVCNNDDGIFFIFNYFGDSSYNTISTSGIPATTPSQATMSATTTMAASASTIPATTPLQATMSATTMAASASTIPATTPLQATMSATTNTASASPIPTITQ
jgi:parallel beta-helix repeat protein